jgi:hypothetical protein
MTRYCNADKCRFKKLRDLDFIGEGIDSRLRRAVGVGGGIRKAG